MPVLFLDFFSFLETEIKKKQQQKTNIPEAAAVHFSETHLLFTK